MIYLGDKKAKSIYLGDKKLNKIYLGDKLVWQKTKLTPPIIYKTVDLGLPSGTL